MPTKSCRKDRGEKSPVYTLASEGGEIGALHRRSTHFCHERERGKHREKIQIRAESSRLHEIQRARQAVHGRGRTRRDLETNTSRRLQENEGSAAVPAIERRSNRSLIDLKPIWGTSKEKARCAESQKSRANQRGSKRSRDDVRGYVQKELNAVKARRIGEANAGGKWAKKRIMGGKNTEKFT